KQSGNPSLCVAGVALQLSKELVARMNTQPPVDRRQVVADGALAQEEFPGGCTNRFTREEPPENLHLPLAQTPQCRMCPPGGVDRLHAAEIGGLELDGDPPQVSLQTGCPLVARFRRAGAQGGPD